MPPRRTGRSLAPGKADRDGRPPTPRVLERPRPGGSACYGRFRVTIGGEWDNSPRADLELTDHARPPIGDGPRTYRVAPPGSAGHAALVRAIDATSRIAPIRRWGGAVCDGPPTHPPIGGDSIVRLPAEPRILHRAKRRLQLSLPALRRSYTNRSPQPMEKQAVRPRTSRKAL